MIEGVADLLTFVPHRSPRWDKRVVDMDFQGGSPVSVERGESSPCGSGTVLHDQIACCKPVGWLGVGPCSESV